MTVARRCGCVAVEGKFYRYKTANHPHTNMAKAALNMMTRTSAQDYRSSNIFMTYAAIPSFQLLCKSVQRYLQERFAQLGIWTELLLNV